MATENFNPCGGGTPFNASNVLDGNWYLVPNDAAKKDDIVRELRLEIEEHTPRGMHTRIVLLFRRFPSHIGVPRLYGFEHYGCPKFVRQFAGEAIDPTHLTDMKLSLRKEQETCRAALNSKFFSPTQLANGSAGCVLNLACGQGKTFVGLQHIVDIGKKTLIICHSNVSVSQWVNHIRKALPHVTVLEFHGDNSFPSTDIVVATIHPLVLKRSVEGYDRAKYGEWLKRFGNVIYDEIHIFGAPLFSEIFDLIHAAAQLGLSATPERTDGTEKGFILKVGPVLDAQSELHIAPPEFSVTVYPLTPPTPKLIAPTVESFADGLRAMTSTENRVTFLIATLENHFVHRPNDNVLIFCNYLQEVEFLLSRLRTAFATEYIDKICGDVCAENIAFMADTAKILVCTYKKGGTAFSPVRFRAVVIWSPTRAMITQAVGRIQRWRDEEGMTLGPEGSWNTLPRTIYDFIDRGTVAAHQYYSGVRENNIVIPSRRALYISKGYKVVRPQSERVDRRIEEEAVAAFAALGFSSTN